MLCFTGLAKLLSDCGHNAWILKTLPQGWQCWKMAGSSLSTHAKFWRSERQLLKILEDQVGQRIHPVNGDGFVEFVGAGKVLGEQLLFEVGGESRV